MERLEIHLICPVAELRFSRVRGKGRFAEDATVYEENLGPMMTIAGHMIAGVNTPVWLWIAAYSTPAGVAEPLAVSSFLELESHTERR